MAKGGIREIEMQSSRQSVLQTIGESRLGEDAHTKE